MKKTVDKAQKGAILSEDKKHRYTLNRIWDYTKPIALFILLNPSTADKYTDDATIRRLRGFSERFGFGGFYVGNLFTWRATDPKELTAPGVERNNAFSNDYLLKMAANSSVVVFGWGDGANVDLNRAIEVAAMFPEAKCFGKTKSKNPKHPLYLSYECTLTPYFINTGQLAITE